MAVDPKKYSIYAQRNVEKQYVDWGQVAKDVTTGITTIAGERRARKDELDKLTNEAMENLSAVPDVQSQNAGALIINASDMSKKNLQIQYDLMKRGLISTKDFQLFLQQQKNDYSSYSTSVKNWDGWYQKSLDKINKGEAAADELYNMVSLEGFGNLQDKALLTNPANGMLQLVQMDEDNEGNYTITPDAKKNPEKFISPHGINMRMNLQSKKKVLTDEVKALVDPLGQFIRQEIKASGTSVTKEGLIYDEEGSYNEFIKSSVDSLTATNNDQMQILAGQGYQIAQSEAEFKKLYGEDADLKKWIKLEYKKGIPMYSLNDGDIEKKSKEIAKNAIDQQLDDIFKEDRTDRRSSGDKAKDVAATQDLRDMVTMLSDNSSGDESQDSLNRLVTRANEGKRVGDDKIRSISITNDSITIEKINKNGDLIPTSPIKRNITNKKGEVVAALNEDEIITLSNQLGLKLDKDTIKRIVKENNDISINYKKREGDLSGKRGQPKIRSVNLDLEFSDAIDKSWNDTPSKKITSSLGSLSNSNNSTNQKEISKIEKEIANSLPEYLKYQNLDGAATPINIEKELSDEGLDSNLKISSDVVSTEEWSTKKAKELLIEEGIENPNRRQINDKIAELKKGNRGSINLELAGVKKTIDLKQGMTSDDIKKELNNFIKEVFNALNERRFGTSYYPRNETNNSSAEGDGIFEQPN